MWKAGATYCELFSYSYADTGNTLLNTLAQANYATILCLYAKCDLGINALGWTESDVASYIADFGFTDKSVAHEMMQSMVSNPGNYCKYVLGWIGFSELKKEAQKQTGSAFSNLDFHKYILDMGSVPFDMLFDRLEAGAVRSQHSKPHKALMPEKFYHTLSMKLFGIIFSNICHLYSTIRCRTDYSTYLITEVLHKNHTCRYLRRTSVCPALSRIPLTTAD